VLVNRCSGFVLLFGMLAIFAAASTSAQDSLFSNEAKQKAEVLLKQMTLDEKIGQLNESSGIVLPGFVDEKPDDLIAKGGVGSILWQIDVKEINRLQHIAVLPISRKNYCRMSTWCLSTRRNRPAPAAL
jgi:beta-glucosidase